MKIRFAHLADCHLGSWKHLELQQLNMESFRFAIDKCIEKKVDFILIAGDLFDAAIPSIDILKEATGKLRELRDKGIDCYIIPGSHDFSVSGKSMIDVLEKAGLCTNVTKKIETEKYFIIGLGGEKKGLEIKEIKNIKSIKGKKDKLKILVLHTTLKEMELPFIDSISIKELPKGFDYYALGHIHKKRIFEKDKDRSKVVYPGALFPCNFSEIEQEQGSFYIIDFDDDKTDKIDLQEIPVRLKEVAVFDINADGENPKSVTDKITEKINENIVDKIVTLRISGTLSSGKPSEINFQEINNSFKEAGAFCILRNVSKLITKEFDLDDEKIKELKLESMDITKIEEEIIHEMIKQKIIDEKDRKKIFELMECLDTEKAEGETNDTFSSRINKDVIEKLNLVFLKNVD